jgi:hypothetical protein
MTPGHSQIIADQLVKIFISYAREDEPTARRLFLELQPIPGVKLWWDQESLLPGSIWENEVTNALEESDLVIVLLSSKAITKEGYIQKEIRKILDLQQYRPPDKTFCIPLRLDDCHPKHPELRKLHHLDLFEDWDRCIRLIHQSINQRRGVTLGIVPQHIPVTPPGGRTMAGFLITFTWSARGDVFIILEGENTIGTDSLMDVMVMSDTQLSREHAVIVTHKGHYEIFDLASTNGTFVNGELVTPPFRSFPLPNYAQLKIGITTWQFIRVIPPH